MIKSQRTAEADPPLPLFFGCLFKDPVTMTDQTLPPSAHATVKRGAKRARYDAETLHAILDAMPLCHVGYIIEGRPVVIPTLQWRDGNTLYWHGASTSRTIAAAAGQDVCVTVSILDGLVIARSAFNHSVNYRSVVVHGRPRLIDDPVHKEAALKAMIESMTPGRWDALRPMHPKEFKATGVLALDLDEASCKVRNGPPVDDAEDYALPIWAGVLPLHSRWGTPEDDSRVQPGVEPPEAITAFPQGPMFRGL